VSAHLIVCLQDIATVNILLLLNTLVHIHTKKNAPYGSAKHVTHDYIRTNPQTFEKIQDMIANKRSNIDIYKEMTVAMSCRQTIKCADTFFACFVSF
jgi:hypothetical protein